MARNKDRDAKLKAQAKEDFKNHQIVKHSNGRWLLQKPHKDGGWDGIFWTEVIALEHGMIYVGGDIDHVIYAYGPKEVRQCLNWIGKHNDIEYYLNQKACIGTGEKLIRVFDEEEAQERLDGLLKEMKEEHAEELKDGGDSYVLTNIKALEEFIEEGHSFEDSEFMFHHLLWKNLDPEFVMDYEISGFGVVVHPRVYFAHAAVARLCDLLDEQDMKNVAPRAFAS